MTFTLTTYLSCARPKGAPSHRLFQPSPRSSTRNLSALSRRTWAQSLEIVTARPSARAFRCTKPYTSRGQQHKGKHRRGVIARCEMGHCPDQAPGHEEGKCNKREECEGCEGELREWKGMKEKEQMEAESEWQGEEDAQREYTPRHGGGEDKPRVSSTLSVADKGYVIKVSKELMGLFCYIEKRKRTMIKELADTLRQIAVVSVAITCVRGVFAPLVEVFKTTPPAWSKLLLMLVSFDSIAICYLAIKSAEPLEKLATITTENRRDIMESVEKEEEMILKIAIEFIRLFKRLRNIAISITVSQTAQLIFTVLRMKDPNFVGNCLRVVQTWMQAPWT